jgi:hypothetical protein
MVFFIVMAVKTSNLTSSMAVGLLALLLYIELAMAMKPRLRQLKTCVM